MRHLASSAIVARLLVMLFGPLVVARAQMPAPDPNAPGLTLTISPVEAPMNGRVTISGIAFPDVAGQVRVTISMPSGGPSVLVVSPDAHGRYSIVFGQTGAEGTYKVSAVAGPKGVPATASFTVKNYLLDIDEDVADNKALLSEDSILVVAVKKKVDDAPDSPARTDMEAKLDALAQATKKASAQTAKLASFLKPFKDIVTRDPAAAAALQPLFDHLSQLDARAKKARATIKAEVEGSAKDGETCDRLDHATEALKMVPEAMAILYEPYEFVTGVATAMAKSKLPPEARGSVDAAATAANLAHTLGDARTAENAADAWKDAQRSAKETIADAELDAGMESKYGEKLVDMLPESFRATEGYRFAVGEIKKILPTIISGQTEAHDVFKIGATVAGDALAYGQNKLFARYCDKFEGGFTATMIAHFYSTNTDSSKSVEWWGYSTTIHGTIVLRYPKSVMGRAVQLTGQIEGGATDFRYREDVFNSALFGKITQGGKVRTADFAPAAADNAEGGVINSLASPTSFMIPIRGVFNEGTITMTMGDATADFDPEYTKAHTVYMVTATNLVGWPVFGHFSLPYVNARFILNHLIDGTYTVERSGSAMVVSKKDRQERPARGNLAIYTIDLKACNPGC
jgi:hypothetical protein